MAESPTLHLTAVVTREDDWYVARCLEVEPTSRGETVEQALANLREVGFEAAMTQARRHLLARG
jgi:predicted RNase H-like HicB family nuclease